jgi:penicillin amidase
LAIEGLDHPVSVVRDTWGVPHITAASEDDLFFAQGFVQAQDRLFQMDLWRRSVQGRLSEVLGANFIERDAMTRRVQYRGSLDVEWASYGPDARRIASAFVRGVNARVNQAVTDLPEEFLLAGWSPELWRPEDLLNRTDAFLAGGGAQDEVFRARLITSVGRARAAALLPSVRHDTSSRSDVDLGAVSHVLGETMRRVGTAPFFQSLAGPVSSGSNAWAIAPSRSRTGGALVAGDPHRRFDNPSLRYLVHLKAPGWNVVGATAPWLPGVAIGHNEHVAWAMAASAVDVQDMFVERLNPSDPHQVEDRGRFVDVDVDRERIGVKGRTEPFEYERQYTKHGAIVGLDRERHLAYALRWSGAEPGAAPELGALALDRAAGSSDFRLALSHWKMPAAQFVFAGRDGHIGSQLAALVPVRTGWRE